MRVSVKHSFTKPTRKVEYVQGIRLKKYLTVFEGHLERYEVDKHAYDKRCRKKTLSDFLASSSSLRKANTARPA